MLFARHNNFALTLGCQHIVRKFPHESSHGGVLILFRALGFAACAGVKPHTAIRIHQYSRVKFHPLTGECAAGMAILGMDVSQILIFPCWSIAYCHGNFIAILGAVIQIIPPVRAPHSVRRIQAAAPPGCWLFL